MVAGDKSYGKYYVKQELKAEDIMEPTSLSYEEWKNVYCKDENLKELTQEEFDEIIGSSVVDNVDGVLINSIEIRDKILRGVYFVKLPKKIISCYSYTYEYFIANCKLYYFQIEYKIDDECKDFYFQYNEKYMLYHCDVYGAKECHFPLGNYGKCVIRNNGAIDASIMSSMFRNRVEDCTFKPDLPLYCPADGELIGYKIVEIKRDNEEGLHAILKLLIPADARRSSGFGHKCRCNKAIPIEVHDLDGNVITNDGSFKLYSAVVKMLLGGIAPLEYIIGKEVYSDGWDDNRYNECSNGIHFFMSFDEALEYYIWITT